jgi:putative protein-disulfide isomerase
MQPVIDQLKSDWQVQLTLRYCMGGLLPSWDNFSDPVNSVNRPLQMVPVWMHAASLAGRSITHSLWMNDPPSSSYPACIAFKCVELQSADIAEYYLTELRSAAMTRGLNIAKQEILIAVAREVQAVYPAFNVELFTEDLLNGNGREAFRQDLQEIKIRDITRFPTFIIQEYGMPSKLLTGYRTYDELHSILLNKSKKAGAEEPDATFL